MVKKKTIAVIMPCYNEGARVLGVLKEVKKSKLADEIVVVDDGSDKETKKVLAKISGIRVVTHKKNLGKSQAMKTGVLNVKSDIVVFVDCDLSGFKGSYIDGLVKLIVNGKFDLVLGDLDRDLWIGRLIGLALILSGQRAIRRDLLLKNLGIFDYGGYLAEVAMNKVFFGKVRTAKVLFKGVGDVMKHRKFGWVGFWCDMKGLGEIIRFLGWKEFISQLIFVSRIQKIGY